MGFAHYATFLFPAMMSRGFWLGLGSATLYAMYDCAGYNNICNVGGEVVRPDVTIPRSILAAVLVVGALCLAINLPIVSVMPWRAAMQSQRLRVHSGGIRDAGRGHRGLFVEGKTRG